MGRLPVALIDSVVLYDLILLGVCAGAGLAGWRVYRDWQELRRAGRRGPDSVGDGASQNGPRCAKAARVGKKPPVAAFVRPWGLPRPLGRPPRCPP